MLNIQPIDHIILCISKVKQKKKNLKFCPSNYNQLKIHTKVFIRALINFCFLMNHCENIFSLPAISFSYFIFQVHLKVTDMRHWPKGCLVSSRHSEQLSDHGQPVPLPPFVPALLGAHSSAGTITRFTSPLIIPQSEFSFSGQDRVPSRQSLLEKQA